MAQFPCYVCGSRYAGKQNTSYPAFVHGSLEFRETVRTCGPCTQRSSHLMASLAEADALSNGDAACNMCHLPGATVRLFLTTYWFGEDRADLYAHLCAECTTQHVAPVLVGLTDAMSVLPGP